MNINKYTFWVIWTAMLISLVVYRLVIEAVTDASGPVLIVAILAGFAVAMVIRWVFIPQRRGLRDLLVPYIIGAGAVDFVALVGILLAPDHQDLTLGIAFLALLHYFPLTLPQLK